MLELKKLVFCLNEVYHLFAFNITLVYNQYNHYKIWKKE